MADINKVWLSGLAVTTPILTQLGSKTPFSTFTLQVNEQYLDNNRNVRIKPNLIRVESLGKGAQLTAEKVRQGRRYQLDGYIRQDLRDNIEEVRVRTFTIYHEDSIDSVNYNAGIRQALDVLRRSRDLETAASMLEELLAPQ
jgi:single-stranded DNA-binding protein